MENNKSKETLSTHSYWNESYVNAKHLPIVQSMNSIGMTSLDQIFKKHLPRGDSFRFIELGCSPGGWMHYFAKNFLYRVSGIDYTKDGVTVARKNLKILNIDAVVIEDDVFSYNPTEKFDIVFSAGLIEHFSGGKLQELVDKHIELCKNGGYVVLTIPNLSGINKILQKIASEDVFEIHNTDIMNLQFFKNIVSSQSNLVEDIFIGYAGKIDFGLFNGKLFYLRIGYILQFFFNFLVLKLKIDIPECKYVSPYIVAIFKKKKNV